MDSDSHQPTCGTVPDGLPLWTGSQGEDDIFRGDVDERGRTDSCASAVGRPGEACLFTLQAAGAGLLAGTEAPSSHGSPKRRSIFKTKDTANLYTQATCKAKGTQEARASWLGTGRWQGKKGRGEPKENSSGRLLRKISEKKSRKPQGKRPPHKCKHRKYSHLYSIPPANPDT